MASFQDHINQAIRNLEFFSAINVNPTTETYIDWQITLLYYVAVHLINAHLGMSANFHYRKHNEVKNALNPHTQFSPSRVCVEVYNAYQSISNLSRISRYLLNVNAENDEQASFSKEKHLQKAAKQIDILNKYINDTYCISLPTVKIQSKHNIVSNLFNPS